MHLRTDPAHFPSPSAKPVDSDTEWSTDPGGHISSCYNQSHTSNRTKYTSLAKYPT